MADIIIKKGDSAATIGTWQLLDTTGAAVNLTAGSCTFVMRSVTAVSPTTNAAVTVVNAATGYVTYSPTAADTATAGVFQAEFHYTLASGKTGTWPIAGYLEVQVEEDLVTASPVGRLVGLGELRAHCNIPDSDKTKDAELLRFLDMATPVVENIVGEVVQRQRIERHDGGWAFISLRHRPIVSVESVVEYRGPIQYILQQVSNPVFGTIYSYTFDEMGRITRRNVGGGTIPFPPGVNAVEVQYTSGRATVPSNIKMGAMELVRVNYQQTQQGGRPQYGGIGGGGGDDYPGGPALGFLVPNRVREMLAPSRRHPSVG